MTRREGGGSLPAELSARLSSIVEDMKAGVDPDSYDAEPEKPSIDQGLKVDLEAACDILDPYARHAEAGASDRWLSVQTGVPESTILRWRRHRGVNRRSYEQQHGIARERMGALDLFRDDSGDDFGIQFTEASPALGQWRPPDIVLRQLLDYDQLARFLHFLHNEVPVTAAALAKAFGLTAHDVEIAIELHGRRLMETGQLCPTCGTPGVEKYCSARCQRRRK